MKNKKRNGVIPGLSGIIGILILAAFSLSGCGLFRIERRTYLEVLESYWQIVFPDNMTEEFYTDDVAGLAGQGDGTRYAVYKAEEEPSVFIADFSREKDKKFENKVDSMSRGINVPEKFLPDWEDLYYWAYTGKLLGAITAQDEEYLSMYTNYFSDSYYSYWRHKDSAYTEYGFPDKLYMVYFPESLHLYFASIAYSKSGFYYMNFSETLKKRKRNKGSDAKAGGGKAGISYRAYCNYEAEGANNRRPDLNCL